jgi:hypothetical protein
VNYGELKTLIVAYSKRVDDTDLAAILDSMVDIAATRIGRDTELMELERIAEFDLVDNYVGLPDGYSKMRAVWVDRAGSIVSLDYVTPAQYADLQSTVSGGHGAFYYTVMNGQIHVGPGINSLNMNYFVRPKKLVDPQDTNYVLNQWPNLYLYGALIEVWTYLVDEMPLAISKAQYEEEIKLCNRQAAIARESGGAKVMRGR